VRKRWSKANLSQLDLELGNISQNNVDGKIQGKMIQSKKFMCPKMLGRKKC